MTGVTFPTRPAPKQQAHPGRPDRAHPCRCPHPFLAARGDTCVWCGHHDAVTIDTTWATRAKQLARARRPTIKAKRPTDTPKAKAAVPV